MGITAVASHASAPNDYPVPAFGSLMLAALLKATSEGTLDPLIGPTGSRPVFWIVLGLLLLPLLAGFLGLMWWGMTKQARMSDPSAALAGKRDYKDMHGKGAAHRARQLRPSLGAGEVEKRDLGFRIGRLDSGEVQFWNPETELFASEEDVLLKVAGPRSNKTSAMVVPAVLSAPGTVITTSNKVDVYTLTVGLRSHLGRIFVLDPQGIAGAEQTWWWNPLAEIRDMADAQQLVNHFSATVGAGHERADPYFTKGAERLLCQLIVAAAQSRKHSLRDVRQWLATRSDEPVRLLRDNGLDDLAEGLQGTIEAPFEQLGGLYETALTALSCLESESVSRYVTPPETWRTPPRPGLDVVEFDPWKFVVGYDFDFARVSTSDPSTWPTPRDTLYLLTREGAGTGAPVVAALVDHLLRTVAAAATARGGRVDPPVRAVLDEAANICPIRNLPDLYSYFGSMSIEVYTFLQSYQQGVVVWGKAGMDKLWSAATVKLIGAGVQDPEFCEHISRLIGLYDPPTWSYQYGRGGSSSSMSTRREPILTAADVSALPKTDALLITSGRKPGRIKLMPWYTEHERTEISQYAEIALAQVQEAAIASLGPNNPLAQLLALQRRQGGA
ncbi:MAG: type IV secretory system conjugative DNA transfer family protein [Pseudonocardiaceae bacterium]